MELTTVDVLRMFGVTVDGTGEALTAEERALFHAEQQCSIPFAELPVVERVFVDV